MKDSVDRNFYKKIFIISICAFVIVNFSLVLSGISTLGKILRPIAISFLFSLILIFPCNFIENKLLKKIKKNKVKRLLAVFLSLIIFLGVLAVIFYLAVPTGIKSIGMLIQQLKMHNSISEFTEKNELLHLLYIQIESLIDDFFKKVIIVLPKILSAAQSILKYLAHIFIGLFIAVMFIINKEEIATQFKKALTIFISDKKTESIFDTLTLGIQKFSGYFGGQIIEAFILGTACYIGMLLLDLPYSVLVAVIIGFSNLIPIVGAYMGGTFSAIIIFAVSPIKALIFIIFVIILQQLESVTTYPLVVGRYVGLNGFWVMVSIIIWGGLLGFWGVLLGVPLTAFLQEIMRRKYYFKFKKTAKH